MSEAVHHPIFARCYARLAVAMEEAGGRSHREELLSGTRGRVVEIGAGTGLNFGYYPEGVRGVTAIEPERYLRDQANQAAASAGVSIQVIDATAEDLPFDDGTFDVGIAS